MSTTLRYLCRSVQIYNYLTHNEQGCFSRLQAKIKSLSLLTRAPKYLILWCWI